MASMPELGSKISLISKSDIRYEGQLYTVDPNECTIALANGKSNFFPLYHRKLQQNNSFFVYPRHGMFFSVYQFVRCRFHLLRLTNRLANVLAKKKLKKSENVVQNRVKVEYTSVLLSLSFGGLVSILRKLRAYMHAYIHI